MSQFAIARRLPTDSSFQMHKDGMPPGIELIDRTDNVDGDWFLDIRVLDQNPIYEGEVYRLKFRFPKMYPIGTVIKPPRCHFTLTRTKSHQKSHSKS